MLDESYIIEAERRARRFSGAWTGTSGTLAADVMRLLGEREDLVGTIAELERKNGEMRAAIEARLAAASKPLPEKLPAEGSEHPLLLGHDVEKAKAAALQMYSEQMATMRRAAPLRVRMIGLAGHVNSGKSAAAAMIPGAVHLQWADPLYRGLAAMLDVPEEVLRDRGIKERSLAIAGIPASPRQLTRTLGTEWGRECIDPDLWVRLTIKRIRSIHAATGRDTFAICGTRFPNEVAAIREYGGEVWWIDRPGVEAGDHVSDVSLTREQCDRVIVNDGSMEKLRHNVEAAWKDFLEYHAPATAGV